MHRFARLDALATHHHRLMMLQGPNGPFFSHLAARLRRLGASVIKVNFNGADECLFKGGGAMRFAATLDTWDAWFCRAVEHHAIDAVLLFGQWRPMHRIAMARCHTLGIAVYVFEEGYVRPGWVTMEAGGVNHLSALASVCPVTLASLKGLASEMPPPVMRRFVFWRMAWWSACYVVLAVLRARTFPHYRHHWPLRLRDGLPWLLAGCARMVFAVKERTRVKRLLDAAGAPFFLVPLQMDADSQIRYCSRWRRNRRYIVGVLRSFSAHAKGNDLLVFKHHPLECGRIDYEPFIARMARRSGIGGRVICLHQGHLPSLLKRTKGVVLINSTVGIQAMYHGVPVCVTGTAFYAHPRLSVAVSMDAFWARPVAPDRHLFMAFYRHMLRTTQINVSFYASCDVRRIETALSSLDASEGSVAESRERKRRVRTSVLRVVRWLSITTLFLCVDAWLV